MSKRYEITFVCEVPDAVLIGAVEEAAELAARDIEPRVAGHVAALVRPKREIGVLGKQKEKLEIVDAFSLAFPEVCEMTFAIPSVLDQDKGRTRFVTIMRSVPGRWWVEGKRGSHTTLADVIGEVLEIE